MVLVGAGAYRKLETAVRHVIDEKQRSFPFLLVYVGNKEVVGRRVTVLCLGSGTNAAL